MPCFFTICPTHLCPAAAVLPCQAIENKYKQKVQDAPGPLAPCDVMGNK
jgi:hypothetical protein